VIIENLPYILYSLSWAETAAFFLAGVFGITAFFVLRQFKLKKAATLCILSASLIILLISALGLWLNISSYAPSAEIIKPTPPPISENAVVNFFHAFYAHPAGLLLGSLSLVIMKISAVALPAVLTIIFYKKRTAKPKYRKRCSSCHHIFPPHTQPHRKCPRCGAYWQYEK